MSFSIFIRHLLGLLILTIIMFFTVFVENILKFPALAAKLPMRMVGIPKQKVSVYQCENFSQRNLVKVLEVGETVEVEYSACGLDSRWGVILSDGRKACYSVDDEKKVERKLLKFYYF